MKVLMTKTQKGSPDGITIIEYQEGTVYDIPEDLAKVFVKQIKCAQKYKESQEVEEIKKQEIKPKGNVKKASGYKNKALSGAEDNK